MTRRKLCVVCRERGAAGRQYAMCKVCGDVHTRSDEFSIEWIDRRARQYERRRWVKLLRESRCPDAEWLIKNIGRAKR